MIDYEEAAREQDVSVAILRWAGEPLLPGK
jgi:hypothetical protein